VENAGQTDAPPSDLLPPPIPIPGSQ
jgi:hypothetical protein